MIFFGEVFVCSRFLTGYTGFATVYWFLVVFFSPSVFGSFCFVWESVAEIKKERSQWKIPHLWYIVMAILPRPIWDSFQFVLKGFLCCFHGRVVCNTQDIHNTPFLYTPLFTILLSCTTMMLEVHSSLCFSPHTWHIYSTASSGHPYTGSLIEGSLLCFKPHPPHEPVWPSSKALSW